MSVINATPLLAAAGGDYQISRSVRLRSSASAYFNRTPASAGNRKTWTWSGWVKRGAISSSGYYSLFSAGTTSPTYDGFRFGLDSLQFFQAGGNSSNLVTTSVYRDPSAWYHIVLALDTTQATSSNRVKMYVNGVQITSFGTATYPSLNLEASINNTLTNVVGAQQETSASFQFDGYMAEVNFIDGQALTPSSFGETDSITGVWKPKKYAGTYGTNGFYLNFSDNSSNTATTIGKDNSGNGNNWTPNNISVTSGATYDSMIDVPTLYADGGNGRGNYCTLSPLSGGLTPTNGNITCNQPSAAWVSTASTFTLNSGKWYFEIGQSGLTGAQYSALGLRPVGQVASGEYTGSIAGSYGGVAGSTGLNAYSGGTVGGTITASYTAASVFQCAVDFDAGKVWFGDGSSWIGGGSPASGTSPTYTFTANTSLVPYVSAYANQTHANFGQRPFAYTPPTGFKALNTQNLPEPTIKKGNQYFDATTYTGNGTSTGNTQVITNSGSMQPDFVWIKSRSSGTQFHMLNDSVRGTNKLLYSNSTGAEDSLSNVFSSFNSNGFTVDYNSTYSQAVTNANGSTYVGWQWKESASAGFDIVTYSGDSTTPRAISHNLGVTPGLVILKCRSNATNYRVYHSSFGTTTSNTLYLNLTNAVSTTDTERVSAVSSSTFTVTYNSGGGDTNTTGRTYVAYLFAEVAGFSKFGSYTGNGSTDGPFVFCGFRPRFVMIKRSDSTSDWIIKDTARSSYNTMNERIDANGAGAENSYFQIDVTANGFKIRYAGADHNVNGGTYIFMAFAESPFKTSLAR